MSRSSVMSSSGEDASGEPKDEQPTKPPDLPAARRLRTAETCMGVDGHSHRQRNLHRNGTLLNGELPAVRLLNMPVLKPRPRGSIAVILPLIQNSQIWGYCNSTQPLRAACPGPPGDACSGLMESWWPHARAS